MGILDEMVFTFEVTVDLSNDTVIQLEDCVPIVRLIFKLRLLVKHPHLCGRNYERLLRFVILDLEFS